MGKCHYTRAFTLLELLVVISVILLLVGFLLPALTRTKAASQTAKCTGQLRQVGIAMAGYAHDHSEFLPTAHDAIPWSSLDPAAWTRELFSYFQTTNLLSCPAFRGVYNNSLFNYFMGSRAAFVDAGGRAAAVQVSRIHFPSEYILSGDTNFAFQEDDADPDNYTQDTLFGTPSPVHRGRLNVLFADLHVQSFFRFDSNSMTYAYSQPGMAWDFP